MNRVIQLFGMLRSPGDGAPKEGLAWGAPGLG